MDAKVAIITGATGGLGTHVTQAFLNAGYVVAGVAPRVEQSDFDSAQFAPFPANLDSLAAARAVADAVLSRFGKIDVLVHTVGGFAGGKSIADSNDATFQRMFDLNVYSAFHVIRAVLPPMRAAKSGRIVAIGSRAAEAPGAGVGAYSASKAALVSLVRTVALENKDAGITANTILPGTIDTPANRQAMPKADTSQWVQPASIADLILWLCGDGGKDVTGSAIPVYGKGL